MVLQHYGYEVRLSGQSSQKAPKMYISVSNLHSGWGLNGRGAVLISSGVDGLGKAVTVL